MMEEGLGGTTPATLSTAGYVQSDVGGQTRREREDRRGEVYLEERRGEGSERGSMVERRGGEEQKKTHNCYLDTDSHLHIYTQLQYIHNFNDMHSFSLVLDHAATPPSVSLATSHPPHLPFTIHNLSLT